MKSETSLDTDEGNESGYHDAGANEVTETRK